MSTDQHHPDEIIATLKPATFRCWGALAIIVGLGVLLLWISATGAAGSPAATIIFLIFAALSFYAAFRIYEIKEISIILTKDGLFDTAGRTLCRLDQIKKLDRSFFAFKPSNGFVVSLKEPIGRAWVPGLWWRFGRSIGVGGVTSVSQAKSMADTITLLLHGGPELFEGDHNPFAR